MILADITIAHSAYLTDFPVTRPGTQYTVHSDALQMDDVAPTKYVRDLGIYIDSDMSMKTHVSRTVSSCFAALRHICSIRRSVCQPVLLSLVTSLVLTRLDYGSVTLNGITKRLMDQGRIQEFTKGEAVTARLLYVSFTSFLVN